MFENCVYLIVSEWDNSVDVRLMQDRLPPDFVLRFRAWLDNSITGRWIGR